MTDIEKLRRYIDESRSIVFFGGAGVSSESGIPDFRSATGIYNAYAGANPEEILSHSYFVAHTAGFFDFYKKNILYLDAKPNYAHRFLAGLEARGKLKAVVTQNIDGLHQAAGSKRVFELHGSVHRNYCIKCQKAYDARYIANSKGIPLCGCGGVIKPDVVLYEEALDGGVIAGAVDAIENADMLIVGGTSLVVYPAAGFVQYFKGDKLVIINRQPTPMDGLASAVFRENIVNVFEKI